MSKQSNVLCVVCVLVLLLQALLPGELQLVAAVAQIRDEFLCQDPIRGPSSLMLSHAGHDELNSASAAPAFTREEGEVVGEEAFSIDKYAGDDEDAEVLFVGDERARDPHRSADEEELADDEENSLLGAQGSVAEGSYDLEELGSSNVRCPECGKHFRSNKSMFGHLRSHPDRGYKGATPPAKPKLLPSHNAASSPPPVQGDRPVARYSQRDPNLNTFEILAAYVMLTLKNRDNRIAQDRSVNVKREPDVPEDDSVTNKAGDAVVLGDKHGNSPHRSEDDTSVTTMARDDVVRRDEHGSPAAEMAADDLVHCDGHSSTIVEVPTKRGRTKRSKEAQEEKDVESASKARRPYICKHCQAVFPTHQALGGHMAAHNKDRRVQAQNEQAAAWEAHHRGQSSLNRQEPKGGGGEEEHRGGGLSAATRQLLTERYTRLFNQGGHSRKETGGGYKRQHTERKDGGAVPVAPPAADGDQRRLFGVDLNVWAPETQ